MKWLIYIYIYNDKNSGFELYNNMEDYEKNQTLL